MNSKITKALVYLFFGIFLLAGIGLVAISIAGIPHAYTLTTQGVTVNGIVTGNRAQTSDSMTNGRSVTTTTYSPIVSFSTKDGRTVAFNSAIGTSDGFTVGQTVSVKYLANDPQSAEINSWRIPGIVLIPFFIGLLFAFVGFWGIKKIKKYGVE